MIRTSLIKKYKELERLYPLKIRIRTAVRDAAIFFLSALAKLDSSQECIRILHYHHVFDDERIGFSRHLKYLKNHGDFISLNNAVDIFAKRQKINGRYFCISFDDGLKSCITNALPILVENKCQAAFFISTDYIGHGIVKDPNIVKKFLSSATSIHPVSLEFLNWDDCRKLLRAGMIIGSHTCSHAPFSNLNNDQVRSELTKSKQKIEKELGTSCYHFACPRGDFKVEIDPIIAKEVGYRSFSTGERGPNSDMTNPFSIRRDHMIAKWGNYQLRYFLSQ